MGVFADEWGNGWTAASASAAEDFARAVTAYLGMRLEIGDHLKAALKADPDMPMAHIMKGYFGRFFATTPMEKMAAQAAQRARALVEEGDSSDQERAHLRALETWLDGEMEAAIAIWETILIDHPRDVMAIKLVQYNQFYLGEGRAMRDSLARVQHAWDEATPGYGFILGSYAFAYEESGLYEQADRLGRRAVEINPADIWAAHAVAHVCEMTSRPAEGERFLSGLEPHWDGVHNFRHHAQWHRGLFLLELGRYDAVLDHYDAKVWTEDAVDYLDISNGAGLLWRLAEQGVDVGDRWKALADLSAARTDEHLLAFADAHFMQALLADGRDHEAAALRRSMAQAAGGPGSQARVIREVGLALADAMMALSRGAPADAVAVLWPKRGELRHLGGSWAQRDFFDRLLVRAALDAGAHAEARAALSERLQAQPKSRWNWLRQADLLESEGHDADALDAKRRAVELLDAA